MNQSNKVNAIEKRNGTKALLRMTKAKEAPATFAGQFGSFSTLFKYLKSMIIISIYYYYYFFSFSF